MHLETQIKEGVNLFKINLIVLSFLGRLQLESLIDLNNYFCTFSRILSVTVSSLNKWNKQKLLANNMVSNVLFRTNNT